MGNQNLNNAALSSISNTSEDFSIDTKQTDGATSEKETEYQNTRASQQYGYFVAVAELKNALLMKATWNVGKGYSTDPQTQAILESMTGWGKDTFDDILFNLEVQKRIYGDSFAEIIRDPDTEQIINLKVLDPASIKIIVDGKGIIKRYEQVSKVGSTNKKFQPDEIFHLCNNRMADNIHGTSDIDALESTILAEAEHAKNMENAMRRQSKPLIIFKLKTDDPTKISNVITKMDTATRQGQNLYLPDDDNTVSYEVVQLNVPALVLEYQNSLNRKFYRALGLPTVLFGAAGSTESGSKMEYLAHEQIFERDQRQIEQQIYAQLNFKIDLIPPTSMLENLQQDTAKDGVAQQLNIQASDLNAAKGR